MVNIAKLIYHICLCETKDANLAVICVSLRMFVRKVTVTCFVALLLLVLLDSNMLPATGTMIANLMNYLADDQQYLISCNYANLWTLT